VKYSILASIAFILPLSAQDSSVRTTTAVDVNGNRIPDGPQIDQTKSKDFVETTERMQSINGRMVPLERVEERVLRDDASGRVVERVIHRFDATGNPTPPAKETIEEQKRPDGSSTTQTTRYQGDVNGDMQLVQKTTTDTHKNGSTETSSTVVQRPLNGSIETVEKKETVRVNDGKNYREDDTTYRRDGNGGFAVTVRRTKDHSEQGGQSTDNTAEYEIGPEGNLQLHGQTVAKTVTEPDGSQEAVVNIYGLNAPGTIDPDGKLKLVEQQIIDQTPRPGNKVVETLNVRRPTVSDPNSLGPTQQISETVCKGKCGTPAQ
jgi:hypothetical protein